MKGIYFHTQFYELYTNWWWKILNEERPATLKCEFKCQPMTDQIQCSKPSIESAEWRTPFVPEWRHNNVILTMYTCVHQKKLITWILVINHYTWNSLYDTETVIVVSEILPGTVNNWILSIILHVLHNMSILYV